jgi:hypothetical protein
MTPAQAAARAASAEASAWIAKCAPLPAVLDWHRELCGTCTPTRMCTEYAEIISEYGAGLCGTAVFWPDAELIR